MVKSMTGFGQADSGVYKVEARSVNHRFLDVVVRMPRDIQVLEERVRKSVQTVLHRGRVEVFVNRREEENPAGCVKLDRELAKAYAAALDELSQLCVPGQKPDLALLARLPDVLRVEKAETDLEQSWDILQGLVETALEKLDDQRAQEGRRLQADILERLARVEALVSAVEKRAPDLQAEYRGKLLERMQNLLAGAEIDQTRILTEAALFADRSSIAEELVRLSSHIVACRQAMETESPVGRKLDFLVQELFRETNTIGSKANDYETSRLVVEIKTELEKIREQVQNIE